MQALPMSSCGVCVCLSVTSNIGYLQNNFTAIVVFPYQTTWASSAGGVSRNRDSEPISLFWLHCVLSTLRPAPANKLRRLLPAINDISVTTCGTVVRRRVVDGGRRRRNVYDKKSQIYAKDNRTAFNCTQR